MKCLQELLFNTNYFIQHHSFICTQLNSSKHCYVSPTIQLNICHLLTQFNYQTLLFLTIQFSISHVFALRLNIKQFYLTHRWYWNITSGQSELKSDGVFCIPPNSNITGASSSDGLVSYPGHSLGGGRLTPLQRCSRCILHTQPTGVRYLLSDKMLVHVTLEKKNRYKYSCSTLGE